MRTYTYKTVGDVKIQVDVYRLDDGQRRPVLLWLHGGGLVVGNRQNIRPDLLKLCRAEGYCLVLKVAMRLVLISAGKFMMGSGQKKLETVKRESGKAQVLGDQGQSDEDPQHEVTLGKPLYMHK